MWEASISQRDLKGVYFSLKNDRRKDQHPESGGLRLEMYDGTDQHAAGGFLRC